MNASLHPDDERLAAFADAADGHRDPLVAAHVASCDRCRALVTDLRSLQAALPGLPDVAPSRALQLIPPVPAETRAPGVAGGWLRVLRPLVAPAYALGVILLVVGFLSHGGVPLGATAGGAPAPAAASAAASAGDQGALAPGERNATVAPSPASQGYDAFNGAQAPTPAPGKQASATESPTTNVPLLLAGLGLILVLGASGVLVVGRLTGR